MWGRRIWGKRKPSGVGGEALSSPMVNAPSFLGDIVLAWRSEGKISVKRKTRREKSEKETKGIRGANL